MNQNQSNESSLVLDGSFTKGKQSIVLNQLYCINEERKAQGYQKTICPESLNINMIFQDTYSIEFSDYMSLNNYLSGNITIAPHNIFTYCIFSSIFKDLALQDQIFEFVRKNPQTICLNDFLGYTIHEDKVVKCSSSSSVPPLIFCLGDFTSVEKGIAQKFDYFFDVLEAFILENLDNSGMTDRKGMIALSRILRIVSDEGFQMNDRTNQKYALLLLKIWKDKNYSTLKNYFDPFLFPLKIYFLSQDVFTEMSKIVSRSKIIPRSFYDDMTALSKKYHMSRKDHLQYINPSNNQ